ncbi:MAG TPA: GNVR domain-containing protein, partial [Rhodothermales bacterium]
ETALAQFGPENPQVAALRDAVRAAQRQYQAALAGQEKLMPIPTSEVPTMARAYVDLERERMIQTRILEVIAPLLEQARMDELREVEAVQIVDAAEPPVKKSAPHRTIIVLATALSAFLLAAFYVLAKEWWRRNHVVVSARLREAAESRETQPAKA